MRAPEWRSLDVRKAFVFDGPSHEEALNVEVDVDAHTSTENCRASGENRDTVRSIEPPAEKLACNVKAQTIFSFAGLMKRYA